jgi:predicted Zn-dependent protease
VFPRLIAALSGILLLTFALTMTLALDRKHYEPLLQLLLAQIYEAKNDATDAASHLREYLRLAPKSRDSHNLKKGFGRGTEPEVDIPAPSQSSASGWARAASPADA